MAADVRCWRSRMLSAARRDFDEFRLALIKFQIERRSGLCGLSPTLVRIRMANLPGKPEPKRNQTSPSLE